MDGLLVLNFGGPRNLQEVKPFLYRLFSDGDVIQLPALIRFPLARLIAARRCKSAQKQYALIGGGSPINETTEQQADALHKKLPDLPVRIGYRYSSPTIAEGFAALLDAGVDRIIALPFYPHYSVTSTGSSFRELDRAARSNPKVPIEKIDHWYDHPLFLQALQGRLRESLQQFEQPPHLLFSAHGIPTRYAEAGDPYPKQIEHSVALLVDGLEGIGGHSLSYQSKVGPVQWLTPYTNDEIRRLADTGVKSVLVCPLSFVSDHIETLYEIDMLYGDLARSLGIESCVRMCGLNLYRPFIDALAAIVSEAQSGAR